MFSENDYVIYYRDICLIKKIEDNYYCLSPILDSSLVIKIPLNKNNVLKKILSKKEALSLIEKIPSINIISDTKNMELSYKMLLKTENREDLIRIIKTTYLRNEKRVNTHKKTSDRDLEYFYLAEKYLYSELSIVLGLSYDDTKKFVIDEVSKLLK